MKTVLQGARGCLRRVKFLCVQQLRLLLTAAAKERNMRKNLLKASKRNLSLGLCETLQKDGIYLMTAWSSIINLLSLAFSQSVQMLTVVLTDSLLSSFLPSSQCVVFKTTKETSKRWTLPRFIIKIQLHSQNYSRWIMANPITLCRNAGIAPCQLELCGAPQRGEWWKFEHNK